MPDLTYYDLLEVDSCATPAEIRTAYRRLAKEYHPDTIPEEVRSRRIGQEAAETFKLVTTAYEVLIDPVKRKSYDEALQGLQQSSGAPQSPPSSPPSPPPRSTTSPASQPPGPPLWWKGRPLGFALIALAAAIFLYGTHRALPTSSNPLAVRAPSSVNGSRPPLLNRQQAESRAQIDPMNYPGLPPNIAANLSARGCKIPQAYFKSELHNAIAGEFTRPGQKDWAVMCAHGSEFTVLLFRNGVSTDPTTIYGPWSDEFRVDIFKASRGTRTGYNKAIFVIEKEDIMRHHRAYGGPTPPPIDHQGIDIYCCEQASQTLYWYNNKWHTLQGAD